MIRPRSVQTSSSTALPALALGVLALMASVLPAASQSPAGSEMLINTYLPEYQSPPEVACTPDARCSLVWSYGILGSDGYAIRRIMGRTVDSIGRLEEERELRFDDGNSLVRTASSGDGIVMLWDRNFPQRQEYSTAFQALDSRLEPLGEFREWQNRPPYLDFTASIQPLSGDFVVLWTERDPAQRDPKCGGYGCEREIFVSVVDREGHSLRSERVNDRPYEFQDNPGGRGGGLAVDGRGTMVVTYHRDYVPRRDDSDVFIRRFSPTAEPLGPPFQVNEFVTGYQTNSQVAAAPSGNFVVVWQSDGQDGDLQGIVARLFDADGIPKGPEFLVNEVTRSAQRWPRVAMDSEGNFAVVWQSFDPTFYREYNALWDVKARLFRADGTPAGSEIYVNQELDNDQELPHVAFGPNGTFLVGWTSANQAGNDTLTDVYARRFSASASDEVCLAAGPTLRCDTGRTGGLPELRQWQAWALVPEGNVPLLGDFDGDGRDDLCTWNAGLLRCDLDHEGWPAEGRTRFAGAAEDTPLLGDVDGDDRADLCVRRKRQLLCDTARDGGFAELKMLLGRGTETPLLGDFDGDGRDDLCLADRGRWSCRSWTGEELRLRFGDPDATPVLGDLDDDGRADPCVLDGDRLRCDAAHDGGNAEVILELRVPTDSLPLLGNLDGL